MRILKLFKEHILALFTAIVLIVISCNADLALPTYMSDIVDVGVQQGGIASGAARRRKRSMREAADYYLSLPETDRRRVNAMLRDAIDPADIDNQMAVVMGVTERAKRGDPQAASVLLKMLGEDTVQEDPAADALAKAKELLGGVDSAID